ncbi:MAG: DoxX family protein, partial [Myxococcales bacterium]|nr:DoxX family protein [Myxococcales bacterium]
MDIKDWLRRHAHTSPASADLGLLVLRLWFGLLIAFAHGYGKLAKTGAIAMGLAKKGFPFPLLMANLAMMAELFGGLFIAAGFLARSAAASVLFTMCTAAFVIHRHDPFVRKEFALAYGIAALVVL